MENIDQIEFNTKLGAVIRNLRENQKLSRFTLAEISGVNEKYIGKIERGESSPSCYVINKISKGLKVRLTVILNEF